MWRGVIPSPAHSPRSPRFASFWGVVEMKLANRPGHHLGPRQAANMGPGAGYPLSPRFWSLPRALYEDRRRRTGTDFSDLTLPDVRRRGVPQNDCRGYGVLRTCGFEGAIIISWLPALYREPEPGPGTKKMTSETTSFHADDGKLVS